MESGRQTGQGYDCREKQHLLESGVEAEGEAGAEGDSETGQTAVPSSTQGLSDHRQNPERDPHKYPRLVCETLTAFTAVKYTQYLSF